jgi:hypothetical protein
MKTMRNTARLSVFLIAFSTFLAAIFSSSCNNRGTPVAAGSWPKKLWYPRISRHSDIWSALKRRQFSVSAKESIQTSWSVRDRVSSADWSLFERDVWRWTAVRRVKCQLQGSCNPRRTGHPAGINHRFRLDIHGSDGNTGRRNCYSQCEYQLRASPHALLLCQNQGFLPIDGREFCIGAHLWKLGAGSKNERHRQPSLALCHWLISATFIPSGIME